MPDLSCTNCQTPQTSLPTPLKVCAKCHTQAYCSRDCQKTHWKVHKRSCGKTPSTPTSGSLSNPPKDEIIAGAMKTIELMKRLASCDGFNYVLRDMKPDVAGLMYVSDFVQRTFREYWYDLLPQRVAMDMMLDAAVFFGKNKEEEKGVMEGKLAELERDRPELASGLDVWPDSVDAEKYGDAIGRNLMIAKIIADPARQGMMGGVYEYPEEVRELARTLE